MIDFAAQEPIFGERQLLWRAGKTITDADTHKCVKDVKSGHIRPMKDRVIFVRCTGEDYEVVNGVKRYKDGDLYIPDIAGDWSNFGVILAVGPDCKHIRQEHIGWSSGTWPESHPQLERIQGEVFIAREELCMAVYPNEDT